jgi:hypothetical protein
MVRNIRHLTPITMTAKQFNIFNFALRILAAALLLGGLLFFNSCAKAMPPYNGKMPDARYKHRKGYLYEVFLTDSVLRETNLKTGATRIVKFNY